MEKEKYTHGLYTNLECKGNGENSHHSGYYDDFGKWRDILLVCKNTM